MYHPTAMLKIAHTREAELVREAQMCGLPKAEASGPKPPRRILAIGLWLATLATLLRLVIG